LKWGDSDEFLTAFLRPSHWYAESAIELVREYVNYLFLRRLNFSGGTKIVPIKIIVASKYFD
jgi:hypothetical protein